jgi:hypothetical protein
MESRTKIVATLGPASEGPEVLDRCSPRQRLMLQPPSVGRHQPVV